MCYLLTLLSKLLLNHPIIFLFTLFCSRVSPSGYVLSGIMLPNLELLLLLKYMTHCILQVQQQLAHRDRAMQIFWSPWFTCLIMLHIYYPFATFKVVKRPQINLHKICCTYLCLNLLMTGAYCRVAVLVLSTKCLCNHLYCFLICKWWLINGKMHIYETMMSNTHIFELCIIHVCWGEEVRSAQKLSKWKHVWPTKVFLNTPIIKIHGFFMKQTIYIYRKGGLGTFNQISPPTTAHFCTPYKHRPSR